jgi:glycosyltransferase involved in cell wall biosynthesis
VTRVLHVVQPLGGGVPRVAAALAHDQVARGWDVAVAGTRQPALDGLDVVEWRAARSPGPSVPAETRALAATVDAWRPDLVHLHSAKAGLAGRLALRGRRATVFQPHAWSWEAAGGPVRVASLAWERYAARWTDLFLCVGETERRAGEAAHVRGTFAVVPNGVDLDRFAPRPKGDARARLGWSDVPLVVCVGRLSRQKGQDVLLDAWPAVRARVPDAALVLVGDGPDAETLRARKVPGVVLVGERDDVPDWLAAADVVAMPSRWEGMSLAMLEAMACGRPLVASDVAGAEVVVGAVVPPDEPAPLADAIAALLEDPVRAEREGLEARAVVERDHDLRRSCAETAALYERVLSSRASGPL